MKIKPKRIDSLSKVKGRRNAERRRYHRKKLKAGKLSQPRHADLWVAKEFEKYGALYTIVLPGDEDDYVELVDTKRQMKIVKRIIRNALSADATKEQFAEAMRIHAERVWNKVGLLSTEQQVTLWKKLKYR